MSLKGIGATNLNPAQLDPLALDWFYTSWGPHCWQNLPALAENPAWVFHLFGVVPAAGDVEQSLANPYHGNWWAVGGNEPDLEAGSTAQAAADLANAQMAVVLSKQPSAKFALTGGSQMHAPDNPYGNAVWIDAVWDRIHPAFKPAVRAFHSHYYAQAEYGQDDARIFNKAPIKRYCNDWFQWRMTRGLLDRQFWLTEIGLAYSALVTPENPQLHAYPAVVQMACDETATERWAWYTLEGAVKYACAWDAGLGALRETMAGL